MNVEIAVVYDIEGPAAETAERLQSGSRVSKEWRRQNRGDRKK
jgi:hypothetical protein